MRPDLVDSTSTRKACEANSLGGGGATAQDWCDRRAHPVSPRSNKLAVVICAVHPSRVDLVMAGDAQGDQVDGIIAATFRARNNVVMAANGFATRRRCRT